MHSCFHRGLLSTATEAWKEGFFIIEEGMPCSLARSGLRLVFEETKNDITIRKILTGSTSTWYHHTHIAVINQKQSK